MLRLSTILIILCIALLGVRIADMIERKQSFAGALFIAPLSAEEMEEVKKEGEEKKEAEAEQGTGESTEEQAAVKKAPPKQEKRFTETEIDILQRLSERHKKLKQWQKEMELREDILKLTEEKVDQKLEELRKLKAEVETVLEQYNEKEEAKLQSLVKIYQNMKPKDAARIFDELDNNILLQVIDKMKERSSAPILAKMNPDKAKEITTQLAEKSRLRAPEDSL